MDRYEDIKPYEFNMIKINTKKKYINASPINIFNKNYFIAAQGPKDQTINDFWTMIEDYNCNIILMLCNVKENGMEKCAKYWSNRYDKINFTIEIIEKKDNKKYTTREIKLTNKSTKNEKIVHQIQFQDWPDFGVPAISNGKIFEVFNEIIRLTDKFKNNQPIVIHCSAGVGRTGTFISMYCLAKEIRSQIEEGEKEIKFNIFNLVRKLKEMRLKLVQSPEQYILIYKFASYLLLKENV